MAMAMEKTETGRKPLVMLEKELITCRKANMVVAVGGVLKFG